MKSIYVIIFIFALILTSCWEKAPSKVEVEENNVVDQQQDSPSWENIVQEEQVQEVWIDDSYSFTTSSGESVKISPIAHATAIVEWAGKTLYIDPAEELSAYEWFADPDMIFVTHVHGDHLQQDILNQIAWDGIEIIVPASVHWELGEDLQKYANIMERETTQTLGEFTITSVPAYNIREEAQGFHPEERNDNGYIIEKDGFRVYFSWDSEDTPEMRALENINIAFVSMNLPFTMTVESAASAVIEFAPEVIFPYHYRGKGWKSDIQNFRKLVKAENSDIEVVLHDWYSE